MYNIVSKFGGSSLSTGEMFAKVAEIVKGNPERRFIVVSAPGARFRGDTKVTDLLLEFWNRINSHLDGSQIWREIVERFLEITNHLNIRIDTEVVLETIRKQIIKSAKLRLPSDFAASRGEYLSALIMSKLLDWELIDPLNYILFDINGNIHPNTYEKLARLAAKRTHCVFPGFYGRRTRTWTQIANPKAFFNPLHLVKVFERGGSDITSAVLARGVGASECENWTDCPLLTADPRVVDNPTIIKFATYGEMRELAYSGFQILQAKTIEPARVAGIPITIRSTKDPNGTYTTISSKREISSDESVLAIAGQTGFSRFSLSKPNLHDEIGFAGKTLNIFSDFGISIEHLPTGIDIMSVVVKNLPEKLAHQVQKELAKRLNCEVKLENSLGLVSIVGLGMVNHPGTAARIFNALSSNYVNVKMVSQDPRETTIIVGVEEKSLNLAIQALYSEFFE